MTRLLILVNVLAFLYELKTGALSPTTQGTMAMLNDGALIPSLVQQGQWWRVITGAFLHAGIMHIGVNMVSLWFLGVFIEAVLGRWRMLLVYGFSLIVSGLGVTFFADPNSLTIGASGAIFGLFGALFAIGVKLGERGKQLVRANLGILIFNLVFTFAVPHISWQAHLAGLIAGFVLTLLIFFPPRPVYTRVYDPRTGATYESQLELPEPPPHDRP